MNQLICLIVVSLVLIGTSYAATINGCSNVTILAQACGSYCNLTFYRNSVGNHGIILATDRTTTGFSDISNVPTRVMFGATKLTANGSLSTSTSWGLGYRADNYIPRAWLNGANTGYFFSTEITTRTGTLVGITGTVTAGNYITFIVNNIAGKPAVAIAAYHNIRLDGSNGVTFPTGTSTSDDSLTVGLCAPK